MNDVSRHQLLEDFQLTKKYTNAIFIGRFQPFHNGHLHVALEGLEIAENLVIVLGSTNKPATVDNPWDSMQREQYIRHAIATAIGASEAADRIKFTHVPDRLYNDQVWIKNIMTAVSTVTNSADANVMVGHYKNQESYWLHMFPQWDLCDTGGDNELAATDIRKAYFKQHPDYQFISDRVPSAIYHFLKANHDGKLHQYLTEEMGFVESYKQAWAAAPYPVKHVTVDAVVVQSGHVLLIRRRASPGKGLWALPGGHLEVDENLDELAAIRELREETKLKVPVPVLQGSIKAQGVFGHPRRSTIGRVITHAYLFVLTPTHDHELPRVKGSDDADKAKWVPLSELKEDEMFDDHYQIIMQLLGET